MKKVLLSLCSAAIILSFISCGSKPAPEEPTTPAAPEVQVEKQEAPAPVATEDTSKEDDDAAKKAAEEAERKAAEEAEAARLAKLEEQRKAAMEAMANAQAARDLIEENDWQDNDYDDYESGWDKLALVEDSLEANGQLDESLFETAISSYEDFKKVISASYKKLAKEERAAAFKAKQDADSVKAGVSRKEQYTTAVDAFKQGDSHFATQNAQKAYESYKDSKEQFISIYNDVYEKRAAALAALEAAKKAVEESANYAEEADRMAPITEEIDGIEDEDAVLLEEDEYADPEEAVVEVEEELEGLTDIDDDAEEVE